MKKLTAYILCALMMFSLCGCSAVKDEITAPTLSPSYESSPETIPETQPSATQESSQPASAAVQRNLVCIGDSIASGYALPSAREQRYSALLAGMLSTSDVRWNEYNYAVPGHTSGDMLALLNSGGAPELANSDIIIVCIGANNVLRPAQTFLMTYAAYQFELQSSEDISLTSADIRDAYADFRTAAETGAEALRGDIAATMEHIRAENAGARVVFMTVYNPYKTNESIIDIGGLPIPMNIMSDTFVTMINEVINTESENFGYEVVDVYSAFAVEEEYMINGDGADSFIADPHPNAAGHELIAQTYYDLLSK